MHFFPMTKIMKNPSLLPFHHFALFSFLAPPQHVSSSFSLTSLGSSFPLLTCVSAGCLKSNSRFSQDSPRSRWLDLNTEKKKKHFRRHTKAVKDWSLHLSLPSHPDSIAFCEQTMLCIPVDSATYLLHSMHHPMYSVQSPISDPSSVPEYSCNSYRWGGWLSGFSPFTSISWSRPSTSLKSVRGTLAQKYAYHLMEQRCPTYNFLSFSQKPLGRLR